MRLLSAVTRFALLLSLVLLPACSGASKRLNRADQSALAAMMADLGRARVVFVGEFHDQRTHHQLQLDIIKALYRQGLQPAIGLEMFDLESQSVLDAWVGGTMSLPDFVARYQSGWNINWAEYDSLFLFARNNRLPLVALDTPPDIVHAVTRSGVAALNGDALKRLPAGTTTAMLPSYKRFMSQAFRSHQMPGALFDNFCAAQALRNSTMAKRIDGYLRRNPGRPMVVIAGVGHAMRRAVPAALTQEGLSVRIVIPDVAAGLYDQLDDDDMDYFIEAAE